MVGHYACCQPICLFLKKGGVVHQIVFVLSPTIVGLCAWFSIRYSCRLASIAVGICPRFLDGDDVIGWETFGAYNSPAQTVSLANKERLAIIGGGCAAAATVIALLAAARGGYSFVDLAVLTTMLACLAFAAGIDYMEEILPDYLTSPLLFGGLAVSFLDHLVTPTSAAAGAVVGWGLGMSSLVICFPFRSKGQVPALGGGDIKILAAMGAWLGPEGLILVVGVAVALSLAFIGGAFIFSDRGTVKTSGTRFGPPLAVAVAFSPLLHRLFY